MDLPAVIILSVTIAAFLALGIWVFTLGRELDYPPGTWVERMAWGVRVRVIFHKDVEGVPSLEMAWNLAWYVRCAALAWGVFWSGDRSKATAAVAEFVVYVQPDRVFDASEWGRFAHAYQGWVRPPVPWTRGVPMMVIRESRLDARLSAIAVHEALHAIRARIKGDPDRLHRDTKVWMDAENEAKARARTQRDTDHT